MGESLESRNTVGIVSASESILGSGRKYRIEWEALKNSSLYLNFLQNKVTTFGLEQQCGQGFGDRREEN